MSTDARDLRKEEGNAPEDREFVEELERRLKIIEAPDYEDPARKDLPTTEIVLVAVVTGVMVVLLHIWGY